MLEMDKTCRECRFSDYAELARRKQRGQRFEQGVTWCTFHCGPVALGSKLRCWGGGWYE